MPITNGTKKRAAVGHPVKALLLVSCPIADQNSVHGLAVVAGGDAIHLVRGPWSAQNRDVLTIVTEAHCFDTTMSSLEMVAQSEACFFAVAIPLGEDGHAAARVEMFSNGKDGRVHVLGLDCDEIDMPWHLNFARDEARALARWGEGAAAMTLLHIANTQEHMRPAPLAALGGA